MEEFVIESNGDLELVVGNSKFVVSSAKMASISPKFNDIFGSCRNSIADVGFPTSAEVFRRIAQSAHGYFVPQADISLDILVSLARVISNYEVPATTSLYALVNFSFIVHTIRPGQVSMGELMILLQVAKALSPDKLATLLLDVFEGRRKALTWSVSNIEADDCALLLVNILMRITQARDEIVKAIMLGKISPTLDSCFGYFQELRELAGWILQDQPSLHDIQLRLEQFQICEEPSSDEVIVQDALQRCWTALRAAREGTRKFVQKSVIQENEKVEIINKGESTCERMGRQLFTSETDFIVNEDWNDRRALDRGASRPRAHSIGAHSKANQRWDMREDWMEVISDTTSVKSCQTV